MKLINIRLLVSDFPAALKFWRDIMMLPMTFGDETMGYAYFDTGNAGVKRGAKEIAAPVDRPVWQARTAHLSDPDGYLVEIYSQLQPSDAPAT